MNLKNRIKTVTINILLSIILILVVAGTFAFVGYSFENPVFFFVALAHLIVTGFGSVWVCIFLDVPVDFPGMNVGIFFLAPSLVLFHGATYTILALNVLEVIHVVLDWKMLVLLAVTSLVVTAFVGGTCAWVADRYPARVK